MPTAWLQLPRIVIDVTLTHPGADHTEQSRSSRGARASLVALHATTKADGNGTWSVVFPPQSATSGGTITVTCAGSAITLTNVAFGDVYLCGGQSNMEYAGEWSAMQARPIPPLSTLVHPCPPFPPCPLSPLYKNLAKGCNKPPVCTHSTSAAHQRHHCIAVFRACEGKV